MKVTFLSIPQVPAKDCPIHGDQARTSPVRGKKVLSEHPLTIWRNDQVIDYRKLVLPSVFKPITLNVIDGTDLTKLSDVCKVMAAGEGKMFGFNHLVTLPREPENLIQFIDCMPPGFEITSPPESAKYLTVSDLESLCGYYFYASRSLYGKRR